VVAPDGSPLARSAGRLRALENRVQSIRPVVKGRQWSRLFHALQTDRDDEWHSIDSTINRAHQHAAGGKGGPPSRA